MFSICKQLSSCIVGQAGVCRQHTLTRRRDNSTDCVLDSRKAGRMYRQSDTYEPLFTADWTASHCQLLLLFCCFAHGPPSPQFHSTRQNITLIICKRTVLNSACGNRQSVRWRDDSQTHPPSTHFHAIYFPLVLSPPGPVLFLTSQRLVIKIEIFTT